MQSTRSSKSGLFLIELIILILFFAIGSGICVRLFVNAHLTSLDGARLNRAMLAAQSAAEAYKADGNAPALLKQAIGGEGNAQVYTVYYDQGWQPLADPATVDGEGKLLAAYRMEMRFSQQNGVGSADISVIDMEENTSIYNLISKRLL